MSDHVRRYRASNGADGHIWRGAPTLLITTTGRKTGQPRTTALIYGCDGDRIILVASKVGWIHHPLWYLNLLEQPQVEVQVGSERLTCIARTATDDEKPRLWEMMAEIWPKYRWYQRRTSRVIPVVVLEPVPQPAPVG